MKKVFTATTTKAFTDSEKHIVTTKEFKIFGFTYWTKQLKKESVKKVTDSNK